MAPLTDRVCPLNIVGPMELSMVMEHVTGFPVVAADDPDTYCPTEHEDAAADKLKPRRPESAASSDSAAAVKVGRNVRMLARGSFVTSDPSKCHRRYRTRSKTIKIRILRHR